MTVAKLWDGTAWVPIVGAQGPAGPVGPQGPKGDIGPSLLATQSMRGQGSGYATMPTAGQPIYVDTAKTIPLAISYTPTVACWWEVDLHLGTVWKTDAAYHYGSAYTLLSPVDVDGDQSIWSLKMQHSGVQTYETRTVHARYKLAAATAYTCTAYFSFNGGTWSVQQSRAYMALEGKAFAR